MLGEASRSRYRCRVHPRRRGHLARTAALCLAVALPLAGCRDGGEVPSVSEPAPDVPALHPAIDDLPESVVTIVTDDGQEVRVDVKVAATVDDRRRGLTEVPELPEGAGMLFVFDEERSGGFWMWNTLVPLDIAYVGDDGAIVEVLAMDPCESDDPDDCPVYPPQASYVAALEVPQGWFTWHGVEPGDRVRWTDPTP